MRSLMEIIKGLTQASPSSDHATTTEKEKVEVKRRLADQLIRVRRLDTTIDVIHKYPQKGHR